MASMSGVGCKLLRVSMLQSNALRTLLLTTASVRRESQQKSQPNPSKSIRRGPQRAAKAPRSHPLAPQVKISFEEKLKESPDIESSMKLLNPRLLDKDVAVKVVSHLSELVRQMDQTSLTSEQLEMLLNDKMFEQLSVVFHEQVEQVMLPQLLSSAECLLNMTSEDLFLTKSLETQIVWLLKSMATSDIIKVLSLHKEHQETKLRQHVWEQAVDTVCKRCTEIDRPQDLISLMYLIDTTHTKLLTNLELQAVTISDSMAAKDLCRIMSLLSQRKRRNKPLLNKLITLLSKEDLELTPQQAQGLLYSCSNLQVYNVGLIQKVVGVVRTQNIASVKEATRLLQCCSNLRWCDEEFLASSCGVTVTDRDCTVTYQDLLCVLLTCAYLNHVPAVVSDSLGQIVERLGLENCHGRHWLDVVWSCAVLRCLDQELVAMVTDPNFINELGDPETQGENSADICHVKLRNIISAAEHELTGYQAPHLELPPPKVPIRQNRLVLGSVIKALSSLAPPDKYLWFDVSHPSGFNIDIELAVSSNGQPIAKDALPESGYHRLAIKVLDFPDLILNTDKPTGLHAMASRHLGYYGYGIIQVPYTEFQKLSTEVQRVQYLQSKIMTAINQEQ